MIQKFDIRTIQSKDRLQQLVESAFGGDYAELIQAINQEVNTLLATDLKAAAAYVRRLKPLFAFMPPKHRPHLTAINARLTHWQGNHADALRKYARAGTEFKAQREYLAAARLGQGLMDAQMYLGHYQDALATGRASLAYFRRHGEENLAARVMTNLGNIYHRLDKNRLALDYYDKARKIFAKKGAVALATVEFNRANIYTNLNRLEDAAKLYRNAAEIYREAGLSVFYQRARYSIAYLHFLADRFTDAIKTFESVYEAFSELGDRRAVAVTRLDLMEMNLHLNQFSTAIMHGYEIIDEFRQLGMRYEQAKANYFVALAHLNLGDLGPAADTLRTAERLFAREKNDLWRGMVNLARSKLHLEAGKPRLALKASAEARSLFARSGDLRRSIDADIVHAEALWKAGDTAAARQMASRLFRRELVSYQSYCLHTLMGDYHAQREDHEKALESYQAAVEIVEKMLTGLYPDEIRFFFVADKLAAYLGVVRCLLQLGRYEESFLTNLRALSTVNQRHFPGESIEAQVPAALLQARDQLRASLKKIAGFPDPRHRGGRSTGTYTETEQKLWSTEQRIRAHLYPSGKRQTARTKSGQDIRRNLRKDELLISFVVAGEDRIGAFCASRRGVDYLPLPIDFEQLRRQVWEMYFVFEKAIYASGATERSADMSSFYLQQLYARLLAPVIGARKETKLVILADGIFAQIPYPALVDENGIAVKDRFDVRVVVNPDDLRDERRQNESFRTAHNAIFAVTSERLPAVEVEATGIRDLFKRSRYYSDNRADSNGFKAELDGADGFIHIATHASRSSENPLFSRIVLADGPFFPFDLFSSGIKAGLVTLSGCQTAATGLYYGNSFSLAKAFYQAGSRYVMASLWPVSDTVSMQFMVEFYRVLKRSNDVPGAYRAAVAHTTRQVENPALWSAFVLLGI